MAVAKRAAQKTTRRPRAASKREPAQAQVVNEDFLRLLERRSISGTFMIASLFLGNALVMGALVWYQVATFAAQDNRLGRHANAIGSVNSATNARLSTLEAAMQRVEEQISDRWRRSHMLKFCLEAEEKNKDFRCPNVLQIAPLETPEMSPGDPRLKNFMPSQLFKQHSGSESRSIARSLSPG